MRKIRNYNKIIILDKNNNQIGVIASREIIQTDDGNYILKDGRLLHKMGDGTFVYKAK